MNDFNSFVEKKMNTLWRCDEDLIIKAADDRDFKTIKTLFQNLFVRGVEIGMVAGIKECLDSMIKNKKGDAGE